jgi:hypothetical protein
LPRPLHLHRISAPRPIVSIHRHPW